MSLWLQMCDRQFASVPFLGEKRLAIQRATHWEICEKGDRINRQAENELPCVLCSGGELDRVNLISQDLEVQSDPDRHRQSQTALFAEYLQSTMSMVISGRDISADKALPPPPASVRATPENELHSGRDRRADVRKHTKRNSSKK